MEIKTKSGNILVVEITPEEDLMFDNIEARIISQLDDTKIVGRLSKLKNEDVEEFVLQWGQDMSKDIINSMVLGYSDIVRIDENTGLGYKNYTDNFNNNYTLSAKESFLSLLESN
jgi:hypothetical protein